MSRTRIFIAAALFCHSCLLPAQVPQIINYQGRVAVGGTNFNSAGQFKFALVNTSASLSFWSNDGTSSAGSQPSAAVSLAVSNGLYSVLLGDNSVANMTSIPPATFANTDVRLRVWFNDGVNGFQLFTPDQRIAAVGYALMAASATGATVATNFAGSLAGDVTGTQAATSVRRIQGVAVSAAVPSDNQFLRYDAANGTWQPSLISLAGDVTGSQSASVVASVGGQTAASVASGASAANAATSANTATTIVNRDASGNFSAGAITASSVSGNGSGLTSLNGGNVSSGTLADARLSSNVPLLNGNNAFAGSNNLAGITVATNANNVLKGTLTGNVAGNVTGDVTGNLVGAASTATNFNGALGGDVTGTQFATVVASVGGQTAANVSGGASAANGATSANTASTIVKRDASGNFAVGTVTGNLSGNAATATSFTGPLAGDVTGAQSGTTVAAVGGQTAANVASGVIAANAATPANTPSTIVKRDGSGSFTAGVVSGSFSGDGAGVTNLNGANLVSGSVSAAQIAVGAVGSVQLAAGAAVANLQASGQSGVAGGGVILTANPVSSTLIGAGYLRIGQTGIGELWAPQGTSALSSRYYPTAVWTGTEMIVWGGQSSNTYFGDGARYGAASNMWTTISSTGAPSPRRSHTAVWTGNEMIIWGGFDGTNFLNNGARYRPASDTWSPVSTTGAPTGCYGHTAVWSGSEMIVWGGVFAGSAAYTNGGGRYEPITDTWTSTPTNGAPSARYSHVAVWTGTEMIIWGGVVFSPTTVFNDGGRFNPATNGWTAIPTGGAPAARYNHTAVWTGSGMIAWGGNGSSGQELNSGGMYIPSTNGWGLLTTAGAPAARDGHTAVWTGTEMIVWGGEIVGGSVFNDGGRYNPALGAWAATTLSGAPPGRFEHAAVWTGFGMIIYGGGAPSTATQYFNDAYTYQVPSTMYLYLKP